MLTTFVLSATAAIVFRWVALILMRAHKVSKDEDVAIVGCFACIVFLASFGIAGFSGMWLVIGWINR